MRSMGCAVAGRAGGGPTGDAEGIAPKDLPGDAVCERGGGGGAAALAASAEDDYTVYESDNDTTCRVTSY